MKMYYFTDPMCSWCYGFSPAIKKLKDNYPDIDLEIISGGFSPGSKQIVSDVSTGSSCTDGSCER